MIISEKIAIPAGISHITISYDTDDIVESGTENVNKMKIFLDAGHGGSDPGAVNGSFKESIAALSIASILYSLLTTSKMDATLSRSEDTYVGITARANMANDWGADLFISIHLNSAENKTASGIETLIYSTGSKAEKLATYVQNQLVAATGWKNRGVKTRPDLGVLRLTRMPAILCEVGFISNDEEARLLFDQFWQQQIAQAIYVGVMEYAKNI